MPNGGIVNTAQRREYVGNAVLCNMTRRYHVTSRHAQGTRMSISLLCAGYRTIASATSTPLPIRFTITIELSN